MNKMSTATCFCTAALVVLLMVAAQPAQAACGAPFLITSIDSDNGLYSYVYTPGVDLGTGFAGSSVSDDFDGFFWAVGFGNPLPGVGADNGLFPALDWLYVYPGYPASILTTWAASTVIDGCIADQGPLGGRCQATLFTDVDPTSGEGVWALITTSDDPTSGDFLIVNPDGPFWLAPSPGLELPGADNPSRETDGLSFSAVAPTFDDLAANLYLDSDGGCAGIANSRAATGVDLISGVDIRYANVPTGDPAPAAHDPAWGAINGQTPLGAPATFGVTCSGGDVFVSYALGLDSGFASPIVLGVAGPFACGNCGNGTIDDGETCDDGNTIPGDGCDAECQEEMCEDADGDGYGSPGSVVCPGGDDADCNDNDPLTFPGADEICDGLDNDCDGVLPTDEADADGDGFRVCDGDCDDTDPNVFPGADEICDGLDNDCDGTVPTDETDDDGDGVAECDGDCNDADANVFPGNTEALCDGIDNDCDGATDDDVNADGDPVSFCDGDCDDSDAAIYPGAPELCDGIDNDCDGAVPADETDDDADGFAECEGDCDDAVANAFPGNTETLCDGIDNDCDGATDDDVNDDGDPVSFCDGDCDDNDPIRYPGADELCDGIDNDCDGVIPADELDGDGDGTSACAGDCDDADPTSFPGAPELCDGIDNDCDGTVPGDEVDDDGDGLAECEGDCDDGNASVNPGAVEVLCDGIDNDCDAATGDDVNADGDPVSVCAGDCDDADPTTYPGAAEVCDGLDNDCDGLLPDDESDVDGDGIAACEGDCNDADAAISPAAAEDCFNFIDDNCDGAVDIDDDECEPMLVVLEYFEATVTPSGVKLQWGTTSEVDNFGFRLLRAQGRGAAKGRELVPVSGVIAAHGNALEGAEYSFVDGSRQPTGTVLYYLEDIDVNGKRTLHGPVQVEVRNGRGNNRPRQR